MISQTNRSLLERMLGKAIPTSDVKITLTVVNLGKLLDAARAEATPAPKPKSSKFEDLLGDFYKRRNPRNIF